MFFQRQYKPVQYFHGKTNCKVLIIGLNPSGIIGQNDINETIENLSDSTFNNSYFRKFVSVSQHISDKFGKENGVTHTDLVKCFSPAFPPTKLNIHDLDKIIRNCREYLNEQINAFKPRIIICNGSHVVYHVQQIIPIKKDFETYYIGDNSFNPYVFRSGFIGQIDNYAKRRLGLEIEQVLKQENIDF